MGSETKSHCLQCSGQYGVRQTMTWKVQICSDLIHGRLDCNDHQHKISELQRTGKILNRRKLRKRKLPKYEAIEMLKNS